jgi:hypothetical protein
LGAGIGRPADFTRVRDPNRLVRNYEMPRRFSAPEENNMTETNKTSKVRVRTGVKAGPVLGGFNLNHGVRVRPPAVRVRTGVKAGPGGLGGFNLNHGVQVRSPAVRVRTGVKAGPGGYGGFNLNHGVRVRARTLPVHCTNA